MRKYMKRYLILLLLLFAFPLYARMMPAMLGRVEVSAGPCSGVTGGVTFLYNGDHTSGTNYACSSAQAALEGTVEGTDTTTSTDYAYIPAKATADKYVSWAADSSEVSTTIGTVWFSVYVVDVNSDTDVDSGTFLEIAYADADNGIRVETVSDSAGAGYIRGSFEGGTTVDLVSLPANSIELATWYRCGYSWQHPGSGNDHAIMCTACGGGGTQADCTGKGTWTGAVEEADALVEFSGSSSVFIIGAENIGGTHSDGYRVADIYVFQTYKATDTF